MSWQTLGHIVTVSFFFGAWSSVAGFDILMPVCSDGVPEPRRVRGVVVYCECLWRSTLHMLIYVLLPDQGHQARHRGYPNLLAPTLRRRRCKCVYLPNAETRPTCSLGCRIAFVRSPLRLACRRSCGSTTRSTGAPGRATSPLPTLTTTTTCSSIT